MAFSQNDTQQNNNHHNVTKQNEAQHNGIQQNRAELNDPRHSEKLQRTE